MDIEALAREWLKRVLGRPARPGGLYVFAEGQSMSVMRLRVLLPPLGGADDDVMRRELSVKVGDAAPAVATLPVDQADFSFTAPRDAAVRLELVDVDGAGNRSEASARDFTVLDTVAPARPGELGVEVVGQEPDPATP